MNEKPVFFGALSFEWRSTAAVLKWAKATASGTVILLDYGSTATRGEEARTLREESFDYIRTGLPPDVVLVRIECDAYSMSALEDALAAHSDAAPLTIDISCMTRPHVASVARVLSKRIHRNWSIAYTGPLAYSTTAGSKAGSFWRDTLILPLGEDTGMDNQGVLLGLLLPGFDADRLVVAFDDMEADAGIVVVSETPARPEFHRLAIARVRDFAAYLGSLSITGALGETISSSLGREGWDFERVAIPNMVVESSTIAYRLVAAARSVEGLDTKPAPVVLYPFGPKLIVFCFTYWLSLLHADYSWIVYPIADTHELDHAQGTGDTWIVRASEFDILTDV